MNNGNNNNLTNGYKNHSIQKDLEICENILIDLIDHPYAFPFVDPVDVNKFSDYFNFIDEPMDLLTIKRKLKKSEYKTIQEFFSDVDLVFTNACTYNPPNSDVFTMAETLKEEFNEKIQIFVEKPSSVDPEEYKNLFQTVQSLQHEIEALRRKNAAIQRANRASLTPKKPTTPKSTPKKKNKRKSSNFSDSDNDYDDHSHFMDIPLTKDEKRKLTSGINKLPGPNLAVVVKMIKKRMPAVGLGKDVEIDIEKLDNATQQTLLRYVRDIKHYQDRKRARQNRKTEQLREDPKACVDYVKSSQNQVQSEIADIEKQIAAIDGTETYVDKKRKYTRKKNIPPPSSSYTFYYKWYS